MYCVYMFIPKLLSLLALCVSPESVQEGQNNPLYDPFPDAGLTSDYCPFLLYDAQKFKRHGTEASYKLWHEGPQGVTLSISEDGIHWKIASESTFPGTHPVVLYDAEGFGGGAFFYKMWVWTGEGGKSPAVIQYTQSVDGETWEAPRPLQQDPSMPLVFGPEKTPFAYLYGPGLVLYNAKATCVEGDPYTFPYVLFYDAVSSAEGGVEAIGLAYSTDGIVWKRYGDPLLSPSTDPNAWDATNVFRPVLFKEGETIHLFYSGSNERLGVGETVPYGHGIGHALSKEGLHWVKDEKPLLYYAEGVPWRSGRTYRPMILPQAEHDHCLWFVGGKGSTAGKQQGIGLCSFGKCP